MEVTRKYTAEETAANRQKWVDALRSGDYRQGDSYLHSEDRFCCLGVACDVAIKNGLDLELGLDDYHDVTSYDGSDATLPSKVTEWLGLQDAWGSLVEPRPVDGGYTGYENLWHLNDRARLSFEEIADVIESGGVMLADD